jgi:hypothetical protein
VFDDEFESHISGSGLRLFCLHCNRTETHVTKYRNRWYYSFVVGMTFGLIYLVGPFRCRCCGHSRLMVSDFLNPRVLRRHQRYQSRSRRTRTTSS